MVFKSYISRISHKATSSSISYTKSVHDMKDTAKKEWHICWNTCCSKAQKTWETSKNCFLKKEVRIMEQPGTTGPIILKFFQPPTKIWNGVFEWKLIVWSKIGRASCREREDMQAR